MIIDSHCHVYPDAVAPKAAQGISSFYDGIPPYMDGRIATLLEDEKMHGVDHAVIFSVATTLKQVSSINHFIAETVKEGKGCFTGLGAYHPSVPDASAVLDEICSLGLRGIKIHPDFQKTAVDDPLWFPLYEEAGRRNLPVLIHCGDYRYDYSNPRRMKHVLELFPHTQFIGAHFGGWSKWDEAMECLSPHENLMVDSCSTRAWVTLEKGKELVNCYGAERILFATDYPMGDLEAELQFFRGMKLSEWEYEAVFCSNAKRVFFI